MIFRKIDNITLYNKNMNFESDEFNEREKILNFLKDEFDKNPKIGISDETIASSTEITLQKVSAHCTYLEQEGYLKIWNRSGTIVWYLLKSKGLDAAKREYNKEFQKNLLENKKIDQSTREKREMEEKAIGKQRHNENIDVQKESNKWAKWGVVTALIISAIGIIISIMAFFKD